MGRFSASLALFIMTLSNGNIFRVTGHLYGEFMVYFDLRPNKRLNKQSWGWWFETPLHSWWRHRNVQGESNGRESRMYPFVCSANSHHYCNGFILGLVVIFIGSTSMQLMSVAFVSKTIQVKTNSYELMLQFMDRQRFIQNAHTRFNSGCLLCILCNGVILTPQQFIMILSWRLGWLTGQAIGRARKLVFMLKSKFFQWVFQRFSNANRYVCWVWVSGEFLMQYLNYVHRALLRDRHIINIPGVNFRSRTIDPNTIT